MLHITDIQARLSQFPEPIEVTKIRESIYEGFKKLEFVDEGHKYFLHKDDGTTIEMDSVTNVCQRYEKPTDWETICHTKAAKLGVKPDKLKREWREKNIKSTSNGSLTHLFAEAYMWFYMGKPENMPAIIADMQYEDGFLIPYGKKQEAIAGFYEALSKVPEFFPVMPEARIYIAGGENPYGIEENIAGTFDALFAFKGKNGQWQLSIFDWKTNASLENEYARKYGKVLLAPFDDMIEEPLSIYSLQLSLYSLGVAQLGYAIVDRKLVWLTDDGEFHKIRVEDIGTKLISALGK